MSRSYRKNLILTDSSTNHRYKPSRKQVASRITRARLKRNPYLTDSYKRVYDSWMIIDYKSRYSLEDQDTPIYKYKNK